MQMDPSTLLAKDINQIFLIYEWLLNRMLLSYQTDISLFDCLPGFVEITLFPSDSQNIIFCNRAPSSSNGKDHL